MSRGQKPRTPQHFPAMKYRAARRDQRAAFGQPRSRRHHPTCYRFPDLSSLNRALGEFGAALTTAIQSIDWTAIRHRLTEHQREAIRALGIDQHQECVEHEPVEPGARWCGRCNADLLPGFPDDDEPEPDDQDDYRPQRDCCDAIECVCCLDCGSPECVCQEPRRDMPMED